MSETEREFMITFRQLVAQSLGMVSGVAPERVATILAGTAEGITLGEATDLCWAVQAHLDLTVGSKEVAP